jgi:hypothetical protein
MNMLRTRKDKMKISIVVGWITALFLAGVLIPDDTASAQGLQWGTVKGRIIWGGKELPKQMPIAAVATNQDRADCMKDGNVVLDERYVVNEKNKGLRWAFVWLTNEDLKKPVPIHPDLKALTVKEVVIDQPLCAFVPHAVALREGQTLVAKNSARINHNLKWTGNQENANAGGNVVIPAGQSLAIKGLVADKQPIQIECSIHPWMKGWALVFNHPYYAVTNPDGAFEFNNAPAGNYRLMVRHGTGGFLGGAAGRKGRAINIKPGMTTDLGSLEYPPPAN